MGNKINKEYSIKFIGAIENEKQSYLIKRIKNGKFSNLYIKSTDLIEKLIIKSENYQFNFNLVYNDQNQSIEDDEHKADCIILEYDIDENNSLDNIKMEWYNKVNYSNETEYI